MKINTRRLVNRMPLMIASFLLAFLLWLLVIAEDQIEAGFTVPLVFDNVPASVVIDGPPTASVYVQMRGSKQAVESVLPQQVRARVDLSDVKPGNEFVQLTPQSIVLPHGITVLGVYPPYLDLKFLARRPVPVKVRTVGRPAEGYEVKEVSAIPLEADVVGPLQRVETIKQVETFPVDISGQKATVKVRAELLAPGDDIRLLQLKPTEIVVTIAAKTERKVFRAVAVKGGNQNVEFSPGAVTVTLEGPQGPLRGLAAEQISVEVDWESKGEGDATRRLKVQVPPGFTVVALAPDQVTVK